MVDQQVGWIEHKHCIEGSLAGLGQDLQHIADNLTSHVKGRGTAMKTEILSSSSKGNIPEDLVAKIRFRTLKATMDPLPGFKASSSDDTAELNPTMCESYLLSPLETIMESLGDYEWECISCHDIIEAYSVLSTRIRSIAHPIMHAEQAPPALLPFKEHAPSLARALKRDLRRAMVDPSRGLRNSVHESYTSDMTDPDIQHKEDLNDLFKESLKIALASDLPIPSSSKTVSLVYWVLQSQRLPSVILEPYKGDIVTALRDALNGQRGISAKRDSLKAVHSLLKNQPVLFATPLLGLFSTILSNITVDDRDCRLQTCNALSGFVLAKFERPDFPHELVSQAVHAFLKPQVPPANQTLAFSQDDYPLHHILAQALESEHSDTKDPVWATITLASLITLADRWLYTYQELRFCADRLRSAFCHKRRDVRQLAAATWGCLVWAFTLLPTKHAAWARPEDPALPDAVLGHRGKAFRFLKFDLSRGKGALLVRSLLVLSGLEDGGAIVGNVSRALLLVGALVGAAQPSDSEAGVKILCKLLRTIAVDGLGTGVCDDVKPDLRLFDGTMVDGASRKVKDTAIRVSTMNMDHIRALSESEILHHWDALVETWANAVERSLKLPLKFPGGLLDAWQSLLLVKADLTQEHAHLTAPGSFASQIAGIVARFLVQPQETSAQVRHLAAVKRLWGVMRNVFAASWLPAEKILACVLKVKFSLGDGEVKAAWSELCVDLISVGVPTLLHVISTGSEGEEITRHLWTVLAKTWQAPEETVHWEELISFLVIPFKCWVMSGVEVELWEGVLRSSVNMAGACSIEPNAVVDRVFRRLGEKGTDALVTFPRSVAILLVYIDVSAYTALPQTVTAIINRTLLSNYPPQAESLTASLEIIRRLAHMIHFLPRGLLVDLICAVEKGVCCWIGDEKEALLTGEHDAVVQQLYCSTLKLMRDLPHSLETLVAISPFLSSAFGRLSSFAAGPVAFSEFWRETYHGVEDYRSSYPDCLKACLLGLSDAYGGSIAEGLSMSQGIILNLLFLTKKKRGFLALVARTSRRVASPEPPSKRRRVDSPPTAKELESSPVPPTSEPMFEVERSMSPRPSGHRPSAPRPIPSSQGVFGESPFGLSTPRMTPQVPMSSKEPSSRKRSPEITRDTQRSKRRKTESDLNLSQTILRCTSGGILQRPFEPLRVPISPKVPFAPPSMAREHSGTHHADIMPSPEIPFSIPPPAESMSQNTDIRKRKRIVEWVNLSKGFQRSAPRANTSCVSSSGPSTPIRAVTRASPPASEDYDTWEAGAASMQEIMQLHQELGGGPEEFVPETEFEELDGETEPNSDLDDFLGASQLAVDSKLESGLEQHRRSHTVPQRPASTPLRRTRTASSARLDALERAYTAVANVESQIPVEDLVQASGLVHRIQGALTEQLTRRLAKSEPGSGR
ncbi:hypothetical protein DXG01_008756 [Tephrocybe rancida]|nr:hypothetical protein DXG01_008756 [Tephrocybe rancida]